MRRTELMGWALEFFERHGSRCCDSEDDRKALAQALAQEVPGIVVGDDYLADMDEMLELHAVMLEAKYQAAQMAVQESRESRDDGKPAARLVLEVCEVSEQREVVADLRIAIEERSELVCAECKTAPPASSCKLDCRTRRYP